MLVVVVFAAYDLRSHQKIICDKLLVNKANRSAALFTTKFDGAEVLVNTGNGVYVPLSRL